MMTKLPLGALLLVAFMNYSSHCLADECGQTIALSTVQKLESDLNAQRKAYYGIGADLSQAVMDAGKSGKAKRMQVAANDIDLSVDIYRQTDPVLRYLEHVSILASIKAEMIDERDRKIAETYMTASAAYVTPFANKQVETINSALTNAKNPSLLREGAKLRDVVGQVAKTFSGCTDPDK